MIGLKSKRLLAILLAAFMLVSMNVGAASAGGEAGASGDAPSLVFKAWKQANYGAAAYPVASGELITDDILFLQTVTDAEMGAYGIEWRVRDCEDGSGWSDWREASSLSFAFDFISVVGDQKSHKVYEARAVIGSGDEKAYGDVASFEVNINVKNAPVVTSVEGTPKAGSPGAYVSPVTVKVAGRHVTEDGGYFLYRDAAGNWPYRYVKDHGFTFTQPGAYYYVRYFDSRGQQVLVGDFSIEAPAPALTFALGGFKADGGANYSITMDPFADSMGGNPLKYVLIDGDRVVPLGAATPTFAKSNIKLMDYAGKTVTIRAQNGDSADAALVYAETEYAFPTPVVKLDVATHNNNSAKWMINYQVEGVSAASGTQIKWRLYRPETDETITLTGGSPGAQTSFLKSNFFKGETVVIRAYTANPPATLLGEAAHTFTDGKERPAPQPIEDLQQALLDYEVVDGNGFTYDAPPFYGLTTFRVEDTPRTLKNATLTASGGQYGYGILVYGIGLNLTLENVSTDVRNGSVFLPGGADGNTVSITGGVLKGAGSNPTGAVIGIQAAKNNIITVTGAELRLTTSNGASSGNGHLVYLEGAGNVVNFVNCRFYVNGSAVSESQIKSSSRFVVTGGSQIQVNGVKVK